MNTEKCFLVLSVIRMREFFGYRLLTQSCRYEAVVVYVEEFFQDL